MNKLFLIIFFICTAGSVSWGADSHAQGQIYEDVYTQCMQFRHSGRASQIKSFLSDPMNSTIVKTAKMGIGDFEALPEMIYNKGLTEETMTQLQSEAFEPAMDSCFGSNKTMKSVYPVLMVVNDILSRTLGLAGAAALIYSPFKVFQILGKVLPALIAKMPGAAQFIIGKLKVALTTIMAAFVGTALFSSLYGLYETIMDKVDPFWRARAQIEESGKQMRRDAYNRLKRRRVELFRIKRNTGLTNEQTTELVQTEVALKGLLTLNAKLRREKMETVYETLTVAP